jgi:hypothetical protein
MKFKLGPSARFWRRGDCLKRFQDHGGKWHCDERSNQGDGANAARLDYDLIRTNLSLAAVCALGGVAHLGLVRPLCLNMSPRHCSTAALLLLIASVALAEPCGSFRDTRERVRLTSLHLTALWTFVPATFSFASHCRGLSAQRQDYRLFRSQRRTLPEGNKTGFSRYLIGQRVTTMSPAEFSEFKEGVHAQQGMPDSRIFRHP